MSAAMQRTSRGPNHASSASGVVHASNSFAAGAPITRRTTSSCVIATAPRSGPRRPACPPRTRGTRRASRSPRPGDRLARRVPRVLGGHAGLLGPLRGAVAMTHELVVRRVIGAPAAKLFDAWTTPEALLAWFGPRDVRCIAADIDLRVGGAYRLGNELPDGRVLWIAGT